MTMRLVSSNCGVSALALPTLMTSEDPDLGDGTDACVVATAAENAASACAMEDLAEAVVLSVLCMAKVTVASGAPAPPACSTSDSMVVVRVSLGIDARDACDVSLIPPCAPRGY